MIGSFVRALTLAGVLVVAALPATAQQFPPGAVQGNAGASAAPPRATALSDMLDRAFCSTEHATLQRTDSAWACAATRPRFDVTLYGADPTGAESSTDAFTEAFAAARAAGGQVYVPAGVYIVTPPSGGFKIDWTGAWVVGDGPKSSIVSATSCSEPVFGVGNDSAMAENMGIRGIEISYGEYCTSGTTLAIDDTHTFTMQDVRVSLAYTCVSLGGATTRITIIRDSYFACGQHGITNAGASATFIVNSRFSGYDPADPNDPSTGYGINITGNADGLWFDETSVVETFARCFSITHSSGNAVEMHFKGSCAFPTNYGLLGQPTGSGAIVSVYAEGLTIFGGAGSAAQGIVFADGTTSGEIRDITITASHMKELGGQNIVINAEADGVVIADNNMTGGTAEVPCIDFNGQAATRVTITGNYCQGSNTSGLAGFGSTTNVVVTGNNFMAVTAAYGTIGSPSATRHLGAAAPTTGTLGGVVATSCDAGDFVSAITTAGAVTCTTAPTGGGSAGSFSAHRNGSNQTIAQATWTKVALTTEAFDVGGYFDPSTNYRWTPAKGVVHMIARLQYTTNIQTTSVCYVAVYKGGTIYKANSAHATAAGQCDIDITFLDQTNGTDYYEMWTYVTNVSGGVNATLHGDASVTFFQGMIH